MTESAPRALRLEPSVRRILEAPNFAHLATVLPDGSPHSVPVWFALDDGRILFYTQSGSQKARNIERDPRIAMSVLDVRNPYRQAWLRGRVVGRRDDDGLWEVVDRMSMQYLGEPFPWRSSSAVLYSVEIDRAGFYGQPFDDVDSTDGGA
jgi:PPOX class probable F420-dependent enzyme